MGESGSTLSLLFEIAADPSKAITATESFRDQASKAMKQFEEKLVETMTHSLGITKEFALGMGVAAGAVVGLGAAMFELADKAAEAGEKIYEMHEKTGISSEALSGLMALSKETGGNIDGLSSALARAGVNLQKGIDDPGSKAALVLRSVMGSAQNLSELGLQPMEDRIQTVLQRIFELNDVGERNRALQALLGKGWQDNVETLKLLAEQGYGPAIEQAKKFGMYFDDAAAEKAKQFKVEWNLLKAELEAAAKVTGEKLIPAFTKTLELVLASTQYLEQYKGAWTAILGLGSPLASMVGGVKTATEEHKKFSDVLAGVRAEIKALTAETEKGEGEGAGGLAKMAKDAQRLDTQMKAIGNSLDKIGLEISKGEGIKKIQSEFVRTGDSLDLLKAKVQAFDGEGAEVLQAHLTKLVSAFDALKTKVIELHDPFAVNEGEWGRLIRKTHDAETQLVDFGKKGADPAAVALYRLGAALKDVYLPTGYALQSTEQLNNAMLHQAIELRSLPQLWQSVTVATQQADEAQKNYTATFEKWGEFSLSVLEKVGQGLKGHTALHRTLKIAEAAVEAAIDIAKGISALGDAAMGVPGAGFAAAQYFAGAAAYGVVGAEAAAGGGGGGGYGGGGRQSGSYGGGGGAALAAGAVNSPSGPSLHVIILGPSDAANYLAGTLNNGVRNGQVQVMATHGPSGQGL